MSTGPKREHDREGQWMRLAASWRAHAAVGRGEERSTTGRGGKRRERGAHEDMGLEERGSGPSGGGGGALNRGSIDGAT